MRLEPPTYERFKGVFDMRWGTNRTWVLGYLKNTRSNSD